jgi:SH3-like domain-containing protein
MRRWFTAAPLVAFVLFFLSFAVGMASGQETAPAAAAGASTPRFVSLKTEGANGRHGPGLEHRIDWIYERAGLPLLVTAESGPWRRVRDPDGGEVWMHAQNLDDRRTVFVTEGDAVPLRRNPQSGAAAVAMLAPGVVGTLTGCHGDWRRVAIGGRVGWVAQERLWAAQDCAGL